jgi:hypothetical protein
VITMMIFIQHNNDIHDPVSALLRFLEILSGIDWATSQITAMGIQLKSDKNLSSSVADEKVSRTNLFRSIQKVFLFFLSSFTRVLKMVEKMRPW